ncbi:protein SPEAR3-like isoform X2 [Phragmites australis]|uniref:protein SPEAR3-like isoform X2 n=1 Tax=Phragmites australis TaxID=29695 RepID=UPI002D7935AB|nr:protein SPEAR3-like isoform X2 [Phragmites australis]
MSASNSGGSMEWGRGRASGSRKGKRAGNNSSDKPRQPQRGLGVAQLEKIRIQSEMAESLHHPLGQPPLIHRTGSFNLEDVRLSHSLPSSPSSSFHANISVSSSYPIHRPNLAMAYGERGDIRYGEFQTDPIIRCVHACMYKITLLPWRYLRFRSTRLLPSEQRHIASLRN